MGLALKKRNHDPAPAVAGSASDGAPSDAELIQRTLAGERDAFEGIVRRYQDRAYHAAYHLLGDAEESRDTVQEGFLRAYKALGRFDFRMNFYTWLYRIVVNLAIDQLRRRSRMRPVALEDLPQGVPDEDEGVRPGHSLELREDARRVRQVLDRLPEKYRLVMVLRDLDGLPCKEIASIVKSTHATVRWRLHIARKMFREHWERMEQASGRATP